MEPAPAPSRQDRLYRPIDFSTPPSAPLEMTICCLGKSKENLTFATASRKLEGTAVRLLAGDLRVPLYFYFQTHVQVLPVVHPMDLQQRKTRENAPGGPTSGTTGTLHPFTPPNAPTPSPSPGTPCCRIGSIRRRSGRRRGWGGRRSGNPLSEGPCGGRG